MKNSLITAIAILLLFTFKQSAKAQTGIYVPELAIFDTAMSNLLTTYNVKGAQLALTYKGRLVYNRGFGYANTSTNTFVQPNHRFRVASVSKPITSIAVMHLIEQGKLHLSDTIFGAKGILNDVKYQKAIDSRIYTITLRNLLEHTGGWDRFISGDPFFPHFAAKIIGVYDMAGAMGVSPPGTAQSIIEYMLNHFNLNYTPGTVYSYSNIGYSIIGQVIEKVTGQGYEQYIRDTILIPIGITEIRTGATLLSNQLPMEVNYYNNYNTQNVSIYDGVTMLPYAYGVHNIESMSGCASWVSSAKDLCKLLVAVDGFSSKPDILLPSTITTMTTGSAVNPTYALGWHLNTTDNNYYHYGYIPGTCRSEIARRDDQVNGAILVNTDANINGLTAAMNDILYSLPPLIINWPSGDIFTSIIEPESELLVSLFPNPAQNQINIKVTAQLHGSNYSVYDLTGKAVINGKIYSENTTVELSDLSTGIYLFSVGDNLKQTFKVIKE
ncbi:MAG: T9SS type A sorting domain-containing protein [Flavobacteriaceae bacterium]|nr:T9SS type A sorting domain-containing protein [Flavobacteriaceae bacterium]